MKFWELTSVMRSEPDVVGRVAARKPEWRFISEWVVDYSRIVGAQDRAKLDFELDDDFVRAVLREASLKFYLAKSCQLRSRRQSMFDKALSALEAFDRYGGRALEDALEYGSVQVL